MIKNESPVLERICRALCQANGKSTDTIIGGKPVWESYRREARAAMDAAGIAELLDEIRYLASVEDVPPRIRDELAAVLLRFEGEIEPQ